jgi:hypothetical protein
MHSPSDAHVVNRSTREEILAAKLLLAVDEATRDGTWIDHDIDRNLTRFAIPSLLWGAVTQAVAAAVRAPREPEIQRLIDVVRSFDQGAAYHQKTATVRLTTQQTVELLTAREQACGFKFIRAYASEHWNRYGRFPR